MSFLSATFPKGMAFSPNQAETHPEMKAEGK
ncbi:MAG: hypothetical protein RIS19_122 [Actinomycetota bacterium]|jgi:hypothetical protein